MPKKQGHCPRWSAISISCQITQGLAFSNSKEVLWQPLIWWSITNQNARVERFLLYFYKLMRIS